VVLALGHSARDTFEMLYERGVAIEAKPFSIGFRIEHPQGLIDKARFGRSIPQLGAAEYRLVHHAGNGRSVYSFCMCPGGTVVAATSEVGRVATNGMSQYSRNERNANAGIVVGITPDVDYPDHPLAGIALQRHWESMAFAAGGGTYAAPAQLVGDFLAAKASTGLGDVVPSYRPGVTPTDLAPCLPDYAIAAIREALPAFGRQIKGFDRHDAVLTGVETRTSSPIRIQRGDNFESLNTRGLFPAAKAPALPAEFSRRRSMVSKWLRRSRNPLRPPPDFFGRTADAFAALRLADAPRRSMVSRWRKRWRKVSRTAKPSGIPRQKPCADCAGRRWASHTARSCRRASPPPGRRPQRLLPGRG
jgi:hypothetical protein